MLVTILILLIVFALAFWLVDMLPIDGRIKQIITIVLIIIAIIVLLQTAGLIGGTALI